MVATLLSLFANPPVVILLLAAGISGFLGDWAGAAAISAATVLLNVTLNFTLSYRSQRAANRPRGEIAPTATVLAATATYLLLGELAERRFMDADEPSPSA